MGCGTGHCMLNWEDSGRGYQIHIKYGNEVRPDVSKLLVYRYCRAQVSQVDSNSMYASGYALDAFHSFCRFRRAP